MHSVRPTLSPLNGLSMRGMTWASAAMARAPYAGDEMGFGKHALPFRVMSRDVSAAEACTARPAVRLLRNSAKLSAGSKMASASSTA